MTGFFAVVHFDSTALHRPALAAMARRIAYRGADHREWGSPDGVNVSVPAAFGAAVRRYTRESADEVQPLTQGAYTVLALAHLDHRAALVDKLRAVGGAAAGGLDNPHRIPDVGLILRAFMAWGDDCPRQITGEFAFVVWDAQRRRLLAAADRLGSRQLYYAASTHPDAGRVVVISTELTAVLLYPTVAHDLDMQTIGDYLVTGSQNSTDKTATVYRAVRRVNARETVIFERDHTTASPYTALPIITRPLRYRTPADYVMHYKALLLEIVRDRMRSAQTVISLSGGMDSPSIAAAAVELVRTGAVDSDVRAISTTLDERISTSNELYYIQQVVERLGIPVDLLRQQGARRPDTLIFSVEPGQTVVSEGVYATSKYYAARAALALLGDGSDELLTPTPLWHVLRTMPPHDALALYGWLWGFLGRRPPLEGSHFFQRPKSAVPIPTRADTPAYPNWIHPDLEREYHLWERWLHIQTWRPQVPGMLQPNAYKKLQQLIWAQEEEFLYPIDFTPTMYLTPFLDTRYIEFALSLPPTYLNRKKYLMREAMRGTLPDEVVERPKTSPGPLLTAILQQPGLDWVDTWTPAPALAAFVLRAAVPPVTVPGEGNDYAYVHLRALSLNQWLLHYQAALTQASQP